MLDVLKELYGKVFITEEVSKEFGKTVPDKKF
jgi:predicted nucleic acid-binding protein